jgi:NADPH2:quinone reductase
VGPRVRRFKVGDAVYGYNFGNSKGGFHAEYAAVGAEHVARTPTVLDMLPAGALPAAGLTALQGIDDALGVKRGEAVIVLAASGSIGSLALQFAKRRGARVLAIASGRDGVALVRRLGADAAVDGKRGNVADAAYTFAPEGADAVLAFVGGEVATACIQALRRDGRLAYPNGVEPRPRARRGIHVVTYDAAGDQPAFARLGRAVEAARLEVPIAATYPLARAADAHRRLAKGHTLGKVMLRIR